MNENSDENEEEKDLKNENINDIKILNSNVNKDIIRNDININKQKE